MSAASRGWNDDSPAPLKADKDGKKYILDIKNTGGFAVPFDVIATYDDGSTESFHQTPAVWERNQQEIAVTIKTSRAVKAIKLDGGIFMDANEKDNVWPSQPGK